MKRTNNRKVLGIWLLLAVFTFPFALQPFHIHHERRNAELTAEKAESKCQHTHSHNCDTCPLCHFFLTGFTYPEQIEITAISVTSLFQETYYTEKGYPAITHTFTSRGPPTT